MGRIRTLAQTFHEFVMNHVAEQDEPACSGIVEFGNAISGVASGIFGNEGIVNMDEEMLGFVVLRESVIKDVLCESL